MRRTTLAVAITTGLGLLSLSAMADENTKIGGKIFADMSHISKQTNGVDQTGTGTGVDVKRFYLTVDHDFADIWSANLTTDFTYSDATKLTDVYVKKAYLQAKFMPEAILRLGSADTPWIPYAESNGYTFRYVEKTLIDRTGFGTSADWGLHFFGKASDGMINYAVSAVNGAGYKNYTRSKTMDIEGRVGIQPIGGLNFAVGGYSGKLGKDTVANAATPYRTANRANAMASYTQPMYSVGAEWFKAKNWKIKESDLKDSADGYSVYGSVTPMDKITVFARFDKVNPNKDTNPALENKYYNLGAQYDARKNVKLALVYKHETTIGDTDTTTSTTKNFNSNEIGIFTEVKF